MFHLKKNYLEWAKVSSHMQNRVMLYSVVAMPKNIGAMITFFIKIVCAQHQTTKILITYLIIDLNFAKVKIAWKSQSAQNRWFWYFSVVPTFAWSFGSDILFYYKLPLYLFQIIFINKYLIVSNINYNLILFSVFVVPNSYYFFAVCMLFANKFWSGFGNWINIVGTYYD